MACAETFGKPLTETQLTLWWRLLAPFEIGDVERAVHQHLLDPERGRFMPLPADIVKQIEGTGGDRAALAWTKVRQAIRDVGPYRSVAFDDPLIHRVVEDMGGWVPLNDLRSDEVPFRGKDFSDRYRAYATRRDAVGHPAMLMGEFDLANRLRFPDAIQPPVLIGDAARATAVLQSGTQRERTPITDTNVKAVRAAIKVSA